MIDASDPAELVAALAAIEPLAAADPGLVRVVRAPGRVNLIGEHTDYNEGFVLPAAIGLEIRIAFVPTPDRRVELTLADDGERRDGERRGFDLDAIPPPSGTWIDYVAGTARELAAAGLPVAGFRGLLWSNLPPSSGLSSSAALELASAWALSGGDAPAPDPLTVARIAQRAENDYVGVRCGLMDQFASACGVAGRALFLDCRSLDWDAVALPPGLSLVVSHSGSSRRLEASAYNERRADCERAVATIAATETGVRSLRDVTVEMLERGRPAMDPIAYRRARHVVDENGRVLAALTAFRGNDRDRLRALFAASHASLRDLFEVSSPELDALVASALELPGVLASRMTGAGFGGCTISLVETEAVEAVVPALAAGYRARTGREARIWTVEAAPGAGRLS